MKRGAPLKRTPLKRVSSKRAKENKTYLALRKIYLEEHPKCEAIGCKWDSMDIHHKMGRGKYLCDTRFFMAVCRPCHDTIEDYKNLSRDLGYILYK